MFGRLLIWWVLLTAELPVWQLLQAECEEAKRLGRKPFCYVDLTVSAFLPGWVPPEAVGAKANYGVSGDFCLDPRATAQTLGSLGSALKAATQIPRFFRSISQWVAAFMRYAPVAVSLGHAKLIDLFVHVDVVLKLAEDARARGHTPYVAILYDDLVRRSWAQRTLQKDPDLDLSKECCKVNKAVLECATSRINQVLDSAGLLRSGGAQHGDMVGLESHTLQDAAASALAKQTSAADIAQKQLESAKRALTAQQAEFSRRQAAVTQQARPFDGNGKGNAKGDHVPKGKRKAQAFFAKSKQWKGEWRQGRH